MKEINAQTLIAKMLVADEIVVATLNAKSGMIDFKLIFNGVTLDELKGIDYSYFSYEELCVVCNKIHEFISRLSCHEPFQKKNSNNYRIWATRMNQLESALSDAMYELDKQAPKEKK